MASECYCGSVTPDQLPYMLVCGRCKKHFHAGCLETSNLSPLAGDIFYQFKCMRCGEEGKEEFERLKMQWMQAVMLALYNLQLGGNGKRGYFRWKEHICAFIDKYWTHLFSNHRKKTTLWHGTVAGTLSTGCPTYFTSGANVLGETGWWKLTDMKPPTLKVDTSQQRSRKKADTMGIDPSAVLKVDGLRNRRGKSSIEAAIALKVKRSTLTEAKEIRRSKTMTQEATQSKPSLPPPSSSSTSTEVSASAEPEADKISDSKTCNNSIPDKPSDNTICDKDVLCEVTSVCIKQEPTDEEDDQSEDHALSIKLKQEPMDEDSNLTSASLPICNVTSASLPSFQPEEMDTDSQFSNSVGIKNIKSEVSVPELFDHVDSDSDLEIDPGNLDPPVGMSSETFRQSPSLQDILASMDDTSSMSRQSEDSVLTSSTSKPNTSDIKSENCTPAESENEADGEESETSDIEEVNLKKRKLEEEEQEKKEDEPPKEKLKLVSVYEEHQLLRKLNILADKQKLDLELNQLRRKLIVRQLKRERGLAVFDLDELADRHSQHTHSHLQHFQDRYGQFTSQIPRVTQNRGDLRILDRFQCGHRGSSKSAQHFPSFLNRLIGTEDDQLQSITSPYTTRVLKPFIRRDRESKPLKVKLLEEIISYPHRSDKDWTAPQSHPIDYCYVRPQHIPSVNALCREFFWPGLDLSECLQYPDFSCVVLYRKIVIGFAFMVPDVKYNEAYISFIFTHPEWRQAGIATFMLYHLIQTCMGKDVTLHVSATNNAMLLYQKFGFKPEELILDFYDKYYPVDSNQCKHAFFLRLRR